MGTIYQNIKLRFTEIKKVANLCSKPLRVKIENRILLAVTVI